MDKFNWIVIGVGILALASLAFFLINRRAHGKQNSNIKIKAPGLSMEASTSNGSDAGIVVEDATTEDGGIIAKDNSGRGVHAERIKAHKDILLENSSPPGDQRPKA